MSVSTTEKILNRVSMISLIAAGLFFIYEGAVLIEMHREKPDIVPAKVAVAGALTIFLGVISLGFAILHLFFEGGGSDMIKQWRQAITTSMTKAKDAKANVAKATNTVANTAANTASLNTRALNAAR